MSQGAPSSREPGRRISEMRIAQPGVHVRVVSATHVGRVRAENEDACAVVELDGGAEVAIGSLQRLEVGDHGIALIVSDGMGGARDGAVAARITVETLVKVLRETPELEHASHEAHRAVWEASCEAGHEGHTRMGATLTAALFRDGLLTIAQVGDSRAYLVREGRMTRLTNDQTMVQSLVDKGLMKPEDAEHSPFRNILTQAMGHQEHVDITMSEVPVRDRDLVLVCSDGLTNELSEDEIRDVMLTSLRLDVAAKRLVDTANARGGRDNITVVLAGIGGGSVPPSSVR